VKEFPEEDFEKATQREVYQLTPFFTSEQEKEVLPFITEGEFGRWHPAFVDITAKGNTKQNGIDEFIKHFGFKLEETMAFGDGGNDIGMLRHAGIGIAMGNANDEVKAAADYVTASVDEDGIYKALKHFGVI
jgi:Cof subfamily protein (haloacid dehalogenase superfamily)